MENVLNFKIEQYSYSNSFIHSRNVPNIIGLHFQFHTGHIRNEIRDSIIYK